MTITGILILSCILFVYSVYLWVRVMISIKNKRHHKTVGDIMNDQINEAIEHKELK